jgi:hypothetical protein
MNEEIDVDLDQAAKILDMACALVVHRMNTGDLPFHCVDGHRRATLKDVLEFKTKVDAQRAAMKELTDIGEELWLRYGI